MHIPVSLASGASFVDCVVDVSGTLVAACAVRYEGQDFAPGVEIPVERTKTVRLSTTIAGYAEISVVLAGKQHYWYVDLPKSLRYVDGLEYKNLTGSVYGSLRNTQAQTSRSFATTGTFTGGDVVAAIDFVKKDIWFFNANNEVKKLTTTTAPIAVIFVPRWSSVDGVSTTCFIVTASQLLKLDANFTITNTYEIEAGVVAASGDVAGNIVLAYANKMVRWRDNSIVDTITAPELTGIHSVMVMPDDSIITGVASGIALSRIDNAIWVTSVICALPGRYWAFDINTTYLYAADAGNRLVAKIALSDYAYTPVYFDKVPRDVVVNGDDVYVSFLNDATAKKFDKELTSSADVTGVKSFGAAFMGAYLVTDLYSDAADVTKAETPVAESVTLIDNMPREEVAEHQWVVNWVRPEFVRLGNTDVTVQVNGQVFTQGYLRNGDIITFSVPETSGWYYDRNVSLIGRRAVTFRFRTVPKLYPDLVTIPSVLEAFLKVEYFDSFVVTGMTYGFSSAVSSNAPELLFSVNGGEFGSIGTIKNDDVVEVVAKITSLASVRTDLDIVVDSGGEIASTWTVLPMTLNGVTKRDTREITRAQVVELFEQSPVEALDAFQVALSPHVPVAYTDANWLRQTDRKTYSTQFGCTKHTQATVGISDVAQWMQNAKEIAFLGETEAQLEQYAHVEVASGEYVPNAQQVTFAHSVEFEFVPAQGVNSQSASYVFSVRASGYGVSTAYERSVFRTFEIEAEYERAVDTARVYIDTQWNRRLGASRYSVVQVYQKVAPSLRQIADMDFEVRVATTPLQTTAQPSLSWRYPVSEFEAQSMRREHGTRVLQDTEFNIGTSQQAVEISASIMLRPPIEKYGVHSVYERRTIGERHEVSASFERRVPQVILIDMPVPEFVHSTRNDYTLAAEDSAFFDQQSEAEAYAASINLTQGVVYKQINGKWIFTLTPTANTAACPLGELPPAAMRRFGYVGGG